MRNGASLGVEEFKTTFIATLPPPCSATIVKQRFLNIFITTNCKFSMSEAEQVKFHIKFVINKEKTKVLFAEAGSDFTDMLLSFLLLPLGKIVQVLEEHYADKAPVIGSLTTLYKGASDLDVIHFLGDAIKKNLISSTHFESDEICELRLNICGAQPTRSSSEESCFSSGESYNGVFIKSTACCIISDDLRVLPNVSGSIIETLSTLGIAVEDMDGTETRNMTFGLNEIIALLKESLISMNPLTALIFPGRQMTLATDRHAFLNQIDEYVILRNTKRMILKVMLQKSTNMLLFAQADCDFVNFLFKNLTTSLGRVEWFLGSDTGLKSIDNLHRSVADDSNKIRVKDSYTKDLLIQPKPTDHIYSCSEYEYCFLNFSHHISSAYVDGVIMYMVSDDLTVAPLGVTSGLSIINELKISLSDIKEVELQVGLEEGLSILKAALTSTTALTDGLIKPFLEKQEREQQLESKS
ncbi:uncharacterized protein LOC125186044 isoform X2 [Salvia hispanica]|uniref:uncharacterized protein LOC125186044 isoform X2 n=1 Tax=Salvia hispanica TaxID=49212 RepID=UPI00200997A9|nr:uncharacterized protein LOC125186044 isoform X2 [Salvia hispanica]